MTEETVSIDALKIPIGIFYNFKKIDILVLLTLALCDLSVGFITGLVIPIFPTLVHNYFANHSSENVSSFYLVLNSSFNSSFQYEKLSLLYGTKNICQMIVAPLMGYLCGKVGPLNILILGISLQAVVMLIYALGNNYYVLLIGRALESVTNSSILSSITAFIAGQYSERKQLGFAYGFNHLSLSAGVAIGPFYGGYVFQYFGKKAAFLFVLIIIISELILTICVTKVVSKKCCFKEIKGKGKLNQQEEELSNIEITLLSDFELKDIPKEKSNKLRTKMNSKAFTFFRDHYFLLCIFSFLVTPLPIFMLLSTLPTHMRRTYDVKESQQGLIWLFNLFGVAVGFAIGNLINHKCKNQRHCILMGITWLESIGIFLISFMPTWWSVVFPLCLIFSQEMMFDILISPLIRIIVKLNHDSQFGIYSGLVTMMVAVSFSLGSLLGPILMKSMGFRYLCIGLGCYEIVYGLFLYKLKKFVDKD